MDPAIALADPIPAGRLGGAVEIRPLEKYQVSRRALPRAGLGYDLAGQAPHDRSWWTGAWMAVAPVIPDPKKIKAFRTETAFEAWLRRNHSRETELWIQIYKKASGVPSITPAQALDVALCWGWIDGLRKSLDEESFLQRYSPRRPKSLWSQINREHVARLTAAGRMTPHGQRQVDAAKADGRWDAAYAPIRSASAAAIPDDLRAAIEASPRARETFNRLGRMNLFALAFRTNNMKTAAGRARKIAQLVAMLERGGTIVPERPRRQS